MTIKEIIRCTADVLFPRTCSVCGKVLNYQEKYLCIKCVEDIPYTRFHRDKFNKTEQLFAGKVPIERATSLFFYTKESRYASILHDFKYHNMPDLARWITRLLAAELKETDFFDGIDVIVPIPLHFIKKGERGYNQSEYIAMGLTDITGIPHQNLLKARKAHSTQTHKGIYDRWENTTGIFSTVSTADISGKHILLIDDVITTGATLVSAAKELKKQADVKVSILTLAMAQL